MAQELFVATDKCSGPCSQRRLPHRMLPPLHQLLRPRRGQRGQEVALDLPHVGQFVGAAIHPGGQAREVGGTQLFEPS